MKIAFVLIFALAACATTPQPIASPLPTSSALSPVVGVLAIKHAFREWSVDTRPGQQDLGITWRTEGKGFVAEGGVLTARHVAEDAALLFVEVERRDGGTAYEVPVRVDPTYDAQGRDIARLVPTRDAIRKGLTLPEPLAVCHGCRAYEGAFYDVAGSSYPATRWDTLERPTPFGSSGLPVLRADGEVIGVLVASNSAHTLARFEPIP